MAEGQTSRGIKRKTSTPAIELCIKSQDGRKDYFRVNVDSVLKKLLKAYSEEKQLEYKCVTFLFKGKRLAARKTIQENGLKDGNKIDAMLTQSGGGPSNNV